MHEYIVSPMLLKSIKYEVTFVNLLLRSRVLLEEYESLIAIFYFTEQEYQKVCKVIKTAGQENNIGESVFLIDCRSDNKISASNV